MGLTAVQLRQLAEGRPAWTRSCAVERAMGLTAVQLRQPGKASREGGAEDGDEDATQPSSGG
jgi:hypothetical protein